MGNYGVGTAAAHPAFVNRFHTFFAKLWVTGYRRKQYCLYLCSDISATSQSCKFP